MPADPRRDYELKVTKSARNIILNDEYFQKIYRNRDLFSQHGKTSFKIFERSFILFTIPSFPALSIHLDEIQFTELVNIRPKILIESAWQDADLAIAKQEAIKSLKDIRYTLRDNPSLSGVVDGEWVNIGGLFFSNIETSFFGEDNGMWTHISTMEVEIITA